VPARRNGSVAHSIDATHHSAATDATKMTGRLMNAVYFVFSVSDRGHSLLKPTLTLEHRMEEARHAET